VDVTVRPIQSVKVVTSIVYTGTAHDILIGADGNGGGIGDCPGQHGLITTVTATYTVNPQVALYVNAWNIFNLKFEPVSGYQTPGPTVLAGIRITL
jgi:vitamin B12 transporter